MDLQNHLGIPKNKPRDHNRALLCSCWAAKNACILFQIDHTDHRTPGKLFAGALPYQNGGVYISCKYVITTALVGHYTNQIFIFRSSL